MNQPTMDAGGNGAPSRRGEGGFAMVAVLLVMVLVSALASTALLRSRMDVIVAGNYKAQRTAEVTSDAGLELTKAMIYGNEVLLTLPISIPATDTAAKAWQAGGADGIAYTDGDMALKLFVKYKQEDNINYNAGEAYADEVVRYGKDYNFSGAKKDLGKQPVYTLTVVDEKTGTRSETDLLAAMGFRTPAAIFAKGKVKMYKWGNATQERIEVTAGAGVPALSTTLSKSNANVFIQSVASVHGSASPNRAALLAHHDLGHAATASPPWGTLTSCYTHFSYDDQGGGTGYYDRPAQYYANNVYNTAAHTDRHRTTSSSTVSLIAPVAPPYPYIFDDVYTDTENVAAYSAGQRNKARDQQFVLLGVGDKTADLDAAASGAAAKGIFNFDKDDTSVVQYGYTMPSPQNLETMMGATFADFKSLADVEYTGNQTVTVPDDVGGTFTVSSGLSLGGVTLGTESNPQVVYFNSNMDINGNYTGGPALSFVTNPNTQMQGYGILVINGDAKVYGSINWKGLMIVRGHLFFRPWQGGNWCNRSDSTLASTWDGFLMLGGDLDLLTLAGGTIILGYGGPGSSAAQIKGIISAAIERKTLSWRRSYN